MTKEGYQPLQTKKTLKIIPPNMGSHVKMEKDGYTWEDLDRSYWEGFNTAKTNMEKRIAELVAYVEKLEKENAELKSDYKVLSCSVGDFGELQDKLEEEQRKNNGLSDNLAKAKKIIREYMNWADWKGSNCPSFASICVKAEQFLKEVEE